MNDRIRFAIIGTGKRSDTLYAPLLNTLKPHVELVGVWGRSEEKAFEQTMPQILGSGERTSLAIAFNRRAAFATDDALARKVARNPGISTTGTIGILQRAVQREILSDRQAQRVLDAMIDAGYYSPGMMARLPH